MQQRYVNIRWHLYPFLIPLLGITGGILVYHNTRFTSLLPGIAGLLAALLLFSIIHRYRRLDSLSAWLRGGLLGTCFFFTGQVLSHLQDVRNDRHWYGDQLAGADAFQVRITEQPEPKNKIVRTTAEVMAVRQSGKWLPCTGILIINFYKNDSLKIAAGDEGIIPNTIIPIRNSGNPFAFRQADYLGRKGKYYQAFLAFDEILLKRSSGRQDNGMIAQCRLGILDIIYENVQDSTTAGLMAAVIINERADLDKNLWEDYSRTGIAHIVAISGMHITMFFAMLCFLIFWIRHRKHKWVKFAIALPLIWLYIIITGYPPSALRAGLMFTLLSIGIFVNRKSNNINILFATGFFILIMNTNWVYDLGFQLSFLSVLSIFIFYRPVSRWLQPQSRLLNYLWKTVAVSISVQVLLFPLLIYYFHQFPMWSVIANIPASAYSFIFMTLSLVLIVFGSIGWDMSALGDVLTQLTRIFHSMIKKMSNWSPDVLYRLAIDETDFWLMIIAILLLSSGFLLGRKKLLYYGLFSGLLLFIHFSWAAYKQGRQEILIVYDLNNTTLIEHIQGTAGIQYRGAGYEQADSMYTLRPAHIGYSISRSSSTDLSSGLVSINGKKVLLLTGPDSIDGKQAFPVDYLIISEGVPFDPALWMRIFRPRQVILCTGIKRYKAREWAERLKAMGITCHTVSEEGAWILD